MPAPVGLCWQHRLRSLYYGNKRYTELVSSTWRLWVRLSSQVHPLVEIAYGIISTGILYLLPVLVGQLSVAAEKKDIHLAFGNSAQRSMSKDSGFIYYVN